MNTIPLPPTTKSLTHTHPLSPLHLTHTPLRPPGPNELLIKIRAAAVNPVDIQLWGFAPLGWAARWGVGRERGVGRDFAGVVVGVGEGVNERESGRGGRRWEVGDEVCGLGFWVTGPGTFSEHITVQPSRDPIARKPKTWTFEQAAAIPLVVLTAWKMLQWLPGSSNSDPGRKRRVVVAGASGGTGMWCVQLAKKLYNCHVTGICSSRNTDFVKGLGADEVIDYMSEDVASVLLKNRPYGQKYDFYADCVGGTEVFEYWHELLHRNAAYVTIVGDKTSRSSLGGPVGYLTHPASLWRFLKGCVLGPRYANVELERRSSEPLERVVALAEEEEVEVVVQEVIHGILDEGSEVWRRVWALMEEGRVRGKIVVAIP